MAKAAEIKIDTTEALRKLKDLQKEVRDVLKVIPIQITCDETDVLVVTHPSRLSEACCASIKQSLKEIFKVPKVVIMEEGMRITSCIRSESLGVGEDHH